MDATPSSSRSSSSPSKSSPATDPSQWFVPPILGDEQLHQYNETGCLNVGRTLTDAGLARMRDECMAVWKREKGEYDPDATWPKNALLINIHHHAQIVRDFYFTGPLVDVAVHLIGPNIKAATSQLTFKMRGNNKPFGWHQDNGYGQLDPPNALTTLTALDDCNEHNGCLWVIPASHTQGQIDVSNRLSTDSKKALADLTVDADDSKAVPLRMRAGESVVFHAWLLHKSDGNFDKDHDRRILFMRYADADAVEVYNNHQPRLGRLLRGATRFDAVRTFEADL